MLKKKTALLCSKKDRTVVLKKKGCTVVLKKRVAPSCSKKDRTVVLEKGSHVGCPSLPDGEGQ